MDRAPALGEGARGCDAGDRGQSAVDSRAEHLGHRDGGARGRCTVEDLGTDEQLQRVTRYFFENLTLVNINTSPADELVGVLGIREEVAQDIIARRRRRLFSSLAELSAVPGVNTKTVEQRKKPNPVLIVRTRSVQNAKLHRYLKKPAGYGWKFSPEA
jgi:helix-hairpin-helix protein